MTKPAKKLGLKRENVPKQTPHRVASRLEGVVKNRGMKPSKKPPRKPL